MSPRDSVRRRRFLRWAGAGAITGLAGCGGGDASQQETPTPAPAGTATPTPSTGDTPTEAPPTTAGPDIDALEATVSDVGFDGALFDTHLHWHGARDTQHDILTPASVAERFAGEDVGGAALFTSTDEVSREYAGVLETIAASEYDFLPFLEPDTREHLLQGGVTDLYEQYADVFRGIGEIVFYAGPMQGTAITADPWPALFSFVAEADVPLMIHPTQQQAEGLATMLAEYPEATVMAHGGEFNMDRGTLEPLLADHENLYWTLDAGSMLNGLVLRASGAADFAERYDQRAEDFKQLVAHTLPWMMEAAPERVMWGTDLATDWNTDPEVVTRVMDWTTAALESLPEDHREKYAASNALELFGL